MDKITIGRNPECDLNISETFAKVSNEHADIQLANGVLTFIDHSSNGTTINGQTVHRSEKVIKQGDKIILAESYMNAVYKAMLLCSLKHCRYLLK